MRIFSLFDAQMRGEILAGGSASQLRVGLQVRVVPEAAGLGSSGDYIFLPEGAMQSGIITARAEWWACLYGTIKLTRWVAPPCCCPPAACTRCVRPSAWIWRCCRTPC